MNKQELIEKIKEIGTYDVNIFGTKVDGIPTKSAIYLIKQLDEPQAGHAEEAPRYVKNILARLRELPLHDREVWLNAIMAEFERDFSHAKWREGYEQGKFEGMLGCEKVTIPQFVAEIIEYYKGQNATLYDALREKNFDKQYSEWLLNEQNAYDKVAKAWIFGYEVEKEHKYNVKFKGISRELNYLNYNSEIQKWYLASNSEIGMVRTKFARKELEEAGFGWVFDCEGIEIEEVE